MRQGWHDQETEGPGEQGSATSGWRNRPRQTEEPRGPRNGGKEPDGQRDGAHLGLQPGPPVQNPQALSGSCIFLPDSRVPQTKLNSNSKNPRTSFLLSQPTHVLLRRSAG